MGSSDPLQVCSNAFGHDVRTWISGKFVVMTIGDSEGVEGLGDCESGVFRHWISSDELGSSNYY